MDVKMSDDALKLVEKEIDPLRRVFVPREGMTENGTRVFRTLDKELYVRLGDGSIRRTKPKVNGKLARRARRAGR